MRSLSLLIPLSFLAACGDKDSADDGAADGCAEDQLQTFYFDADGDGHAGLEHSVMACDAPEGAVPEAEVSDCDDNDAAVFPGGVERCDGLDNDCDGALDEDDADDHQTFFVDADADGFGDAEVRACALPPNASDVGGDCDDADPAVHPAAEEVCNDIDDDCDGAVDFDGWIPADYSSLSEAAEMAPDGAHICVDAGTYQDGEISLERSITFEGQGTDQTVLDGGGSWLFQDAEWRGHSLGLKNMRLVDLGTSTGGSVVFDSTYGAEIVMHDLEIDGISCDYQYGCYGLLAYAEYGSLVDLRDVRVRDLQASPTYAYATSYGLLVYSDNSEVRMDGVELTDSKVIGNLAGVVYGYGSDVDIQGLSVHENQILPNYAMYGMGAYIESYGNAVSLSDISIQDNTVDSTHSYMYVTGGLFGQIYSYGGDAIALSRLDIRGNEITGAPSQYVTGGVLYAEGANIQVHNAIVAGNRIEAEAATIASGTQYVSGGLVYMAYGELMWTQGDLVGNRFASDEVYGGLFYLEDEAEVTVHNTNLMDLDLGDDPWILGSVAYIDDAVDPSDAPFVAAYVNGTGLPAVEAVVDGDEVAVPIDGTTEDPMYLSTSGDASDWDLHLGDGSPLIDAGDPAVQDVDGSVSDLGAYGGPGGG